MKKITFLLLLLCISFYSNAQIIEDFETDPPAGWTFMQTEGDDPGFVQTDIRANSGTYSFYHNDDNVAAESTSWMISPAYTVNAGDLLTFFYNHNYTTIGYGVENGVWISTASADPIANPGDFTLLYDLLANASEDTWTEYSQSLDAYAGQTIYIAFKYVGDFEDELYIDTFSLDAAPSCIPADFTLAQGANNCPTEEFFIEVDLTDLGTAASVNILNDGGAPAINGVDGSASPYSVGPFPAGTDVMITVEDAADSACNDSDSLTTLASCPPDCATAPITPSDGATGLSAFAPINFSWTAPASGPVPDSYDFYVGFMSDGSDQGLFDNTTDTFYDVAFGEYGLTVYWSIVPITNGVPANGPCALWSATSELPDGSSCLNAPYGQWPGTVYDVAASAACDGITVNEITDCGYNGEYSMVTVVNGENYRFESSVATDFVTISNEDGSVAYIGGEGSVTWTSNVSGNVRFYTHVDNACGDLDECRSRSVVCAVTLSTEDVIASELFTYFPNPVSNNLTIKAQKNIQNVAVYNMLGQTVINSAPNAVESNVDMSALKSGAYFVKVTVEGITETIRIIRN